MVGEQIVRQRKPPRRADAIYLDGVGDRTHCGARPTHQGDRAPRRAVVSGHDPAGRQHQGVAGAAMRLRFRLTDPDGAIEREPVPHVGRDARPLPPREPGQQNSWMLGPNSAVERMSAIHGRGRDQLSQPGKLHPGFIHGLDDQHTGRQVVVPERPPGGTHGGHMGHQPGHEKIGGNEFSDRREHGVSLPFPVLLTGNWLTDRIILGLAAARPAGLFTGAANPQIWGALSLKEHSVGQDSVAWRR